MNPIPPQFRSGVVAPVECIKTGWATIKDRYWLFLGISLVAILIGKAVPIVLIGPMMCGTYICLLRKMRGQTVQFEMLFKGFDFFVPSLVAAAIEMIPALVLILPMTGIFIIFTISVVPRNGASQEGPPLIFFLALFVFVIVVMLIAFLVATLFIFAYPLIVDRNLSGVNAVKTSIKAASQNLGGLVGLMLLNFGLAILGLICCYVGAFFVMPISLASYAAAYHQVFPDVGPGFMAPPPPPSNWA